MQAECISVRFRSRDFFHRAKNVVRAVAVSQVSMRVTAVILGEAKSGDVIDIPPRGGRCPGPVVASEYVLSQHCHPDWGCGWTWFDATRAVGMDQYLRDRHMVTRKETGEKLAAWRHYQIDSKSLRLWIDTSDVDDDDVASAPMSLTREAIDTLDYMLDTYEAAETCDPSAARGVREENADRLLDSLAGFPKEEKQSEYDAWLEAHEGEADLWNSDALKHFDDLILKDPAWTRALRCLQQRYSQR